uniref:Uncharacterized protein n=1 Tax=Myoviridae sp. ctdNl2 TaxID=2825140 RepID=A0A8S5QHH9_9CAUD|nr:MAG TPA: hypothetical protein [Myoviridae sp. ctdNl2]DAJ55482.1 MAG TPA: hypothetical protein [Caudoviricetes sp.]
MNVALSTNILILNINLIYSFSNNSSTVCNIIYNNIDICCS